MKTTCLVETYPQEEAARANRRKEAKSDGQKLAIATLDGAGYYGTWAIVTVDGISALIQPQQLRLAAKSAANCIGGVVQVRVTLCTFKEAPTNYAESINEKPRRAEANIEVHSTGKPPYLRIALGDKSVVAALDAVEAAIENVTRVR